MKIDMTDLLNSITENLKRIDYIKPEEIPNIDLYMDQVTTFMDEHLAGTKRRDEDKILTKTMINNYSKNNLLPPSVKKKYSKEHVLLLIFIYYFKSILSIKDIETVLAPLRDKYFSDEAALSLSELYTEVCKLEKSRIKPLSETAGRLPSRTVPATEAAAFQIHRRGRQAPGGEFLHSAAFSAPAWQSC